MAIFGVYLIGIGLLGLAKKHPLLFPASQYIGLMFFVFLMGLALSFVRFFDSQKIRDPLLNVAPFMLLILIALLAFSARSQLLGYMIFGIYDDTFRDAITYALKKLNLPYQENISKIRLLSLNVDLQAQVTSWTGCATIHIKQSKHSNHIKNIADTMNKYYANKSVKVNNFAFVSSLIMGICIIIYVLVRTFF